MKLKLEHPNIYTIIPIFFIFQRTNSDLAQKMQNRDPSVHATAEWQLMYFN